jgi:acyl carrier protein
MDDGTRLEDAVFALIEQTLGRSFARAAITRDTNLRRDLGLDSLALATLLVRFAEDELGVDPDELIETLAIDQIRTVGDVVAMGASPIAAGASEAGRAAEGSGA